MLQRQGTVSCLAIVHLWLVASLAVVTPTFGEDDDDSRPYLHFRSGEFNPVWGVNDLWGFSAGLNLNRHWGVELASDLFEREVEPDFFGGAKVGEESIITLIPQLRWRYPLGNRRFVPYLLAGVGPAFVQFNDQTRTGVGYAIESDEVKLAAVAGLGFDYYLSDEIAFVLEGKYIWVDEVTMDLGGGIREGINYSSPTATIGLRMHLRENRPTIMAEMERDIPSRLYFGVRVGGSVLTDDRIGEGLTLAPEASAIGGTVNQFGSLMLGLNLGSSFSLEAIVAGCEYTIQAAGFGQLGEYAVFTALPQLRYRVPLREGRLVPYVFLGAGVTYGEDNDSRRPGSDLRLDARGIHPAITVGAGVEYFITRNFAFVGDIWWLQTWDHQFVIEDRTDPNRRLEQSGDLSSFQLQLGFRAYLFDF